MQRFIVFKGSQSHGTALFSDKENVLITANPLDAAMPTNYSISLTGLQEHALLIVRLNEVELPPPGSKVASISPYIYQIELGGQLSDV